MTKTKFTPGPWFAHDGYAEQDYVYSRDDKCTSAHIICKVFTRPKTEVRGCPDAHLIAAAPELYAFLEKLVNQIEENGLMQYDAIHNGENWVLEEAKELLRKARGESEVQA